MTTKWSSNSHGVSLAYFYSDNHDDTIIISSLIKKHVSNGIKTHFRIHREHNFIELQGEISLISPSTEKRILRLNHKPFSIRIYQVFHFILSNNLNY